MIRKEKIATSEVKYAGSYIAKEQKNISVTKKQRDTAMDLVRIVAFLLVVTVHSFSVCGFYEHNMTGINMFAATTIRNFSMVCVPLFLVLSGYLMCHKKLEKKYYKGILKTIYMYLLAGLCCVIFNIIVGKQELNIFDIIKSFFDFSAAPYGWYIEMYIGLFMMIPFLNLLYDNLKNIKQKKILIITALLLTAIPGLANILININGQFKPAEAENIIQLIPDYWICLYPITYYFTGAFLRENLHRVKIKSSTLFVILTTCALTSGVISFIASYGGVFFQQGPWQDHSSILVWIMTVILFMLIGRLKPNKWPTKLRSFCTRLSGLCLGGYLVSYIFDTIIRLNYGNLSKYGLWSYAIDILFVFVCSLVLSFMLNQILSIKNIFKKKKQNSKSYPS